MKTLRFLLLAPALALFPARADMVHRWSFNQPALAAVPSGTPVTDSVSRAVAVIRSGTAAANQASFDGTALTLPGTTTGNQAASGISAYLDLPNGIISPKPNLTVEAWVRPLSSQNWQRLLDFGRVSVTSGPGAASGEITEPAAAPGSYTAVDNLMLSLNNAATFGSHRTEGRLNNSTRISADANLSGSTVAGTEYHYALTVTDATGLYGSAGCRAQFYRNGVLQTTTDLNFRLSQVADVNNWIGRSLYGADRCSNFRVNELRIHNRSLGAAELLASFNAGADAAFPAPVGVADSFDMHRGQKARLAVLANDTGAFTASTLEVVQPPQSGSATADARGGILYVHNGLATGPDTFTYRVGGPGGVSAETTVTVNVPDTLRLANPHLNVPATPPPLAFQLNLAFTGVNDPTAMASPPGDTRRLFVCEKGGLLRLIPDVTAAAPAATTFLDLPALLTSRGETIRTASEQGLLGLAFHPGYATNRQFFVFYSVTKSSLVYLRLSRFTAQALNPDLADSASERILIEQRDEADNHNGGDLHFGPDGYLYVSLGDEGNQNDSLNNSQTITKDFFSALLRIDVDKRPGNPEPNPHASILLDGGLARYAVPADNPFVGATTYNGAGVTPSQVRTEFWATGLRNPWRFSFDPATGELWLADVGQGTWEEVDLIERGGNYGWAYREANANGPKSASAPANFNTLYHKPPLYAYVHTSVAGGDASFKGNSVTGGIVYRGARHAGLAGKYVFADYTSGHIWTLVRNGAAAPTVTRIAGEGGIVAFGRDPSNGDVLLADLDGDRILRLTEETPAGAYPGTLSETGLFADLTDLAPAPGLLPYEVNLPFWSDHASKRRWFIIPDAADMTWAQDAPWTYPAGQIWVKHFDLETIRGNPATRKRLETRVLVRNPGGAYGVSYRWNDAGTEATLVPDDGADLDLAVTVDGSPVVQRWRIPSRAECLICHNPQAGHALSFSTRQLNRESLFPGHPGPALARLEEAGYFTNDVPPPNVLPRHLRPDETAYPAEARARSYLDVNCAYCHQPGGTAGASAWDGRAHLTLAQTGLLLGNAASNGGDPANKLVVPGDLARSVVYNRVAASNGFTRMPPIATAELDAVNIALLAEWIGQSLTNRLAYADWRVREFGADGTPEGAPGFDADDDGADNFAEFLWGTGPLVPGSVPRAELRVDGGMAAVSSALPANRGAVVETSLDLLSWWPWDAPGNGGLPTPGGLFRVEAPAGPGMQYFRLRVQEN